MVAIHNLHVAYGQSNLKQMYENVKQCCLGY